MHRPLFYLVERTMTELMMILSLASPVILVAVVLLLVLRQ
jgi:hypothetical protein